MQLLKYKGNTSKEIHLNENNEDQNLVDNLPSLADDSIISLDIRCCEQCQNQYQQTQHIKMCSACLVAQKRNLCGSCQKRQKVFIISKLLLYRIIAFKLNSS